MSNDGTAEAQLDLDRNRNNQKLKFRFEHIFRKYEHDFTGIGDEFDIHTDQIVVNNGHLEHMRNEADSGTTASSRFVKTFREKLAHEDESTTSEDDDDDDDGSGDDGSDTDPAEGDAVELSGHSLDNGSSLESRQVMPQHTPRLPQLFRLLAGEGTSQEPLEVPDDEDSGDDTVSVGTSRGQTPSESETLHGVKHSSSAEALAKGKRPMADDDTVRALGISIATQLAKLMGASSKKKSKRKAPVMHGSTDPAWDYPALNTTKRTKRKRDTSPVPPPHLSSSPHTTSPEGRSLWAVHDSAQPGKRRRRAYTSSAVNPKVRRYGSTTDVSDNKRCWNCSLTRSPSWREGPHGQDLCLPCGQYYEHHGRMKGFDSATPPVVEQEQEQLADPTVRELADLSQDEEEPEHTDSRALGQTPEFAPKAEEDESATPSIPYQANTSRQLLSSASKRKAATKWTFEEDALLIRLKERDHLSWDDIALHFPSRATFGIQKNYSSRLKGISCPGRQLFNAQLQETTDDDDATETETDAGFDNIYDLGWSPQQDELLVALRDADNLEWAEIADLLPGHAPDAVQRRYALLLNLATNRDSPDSHRKSAKHSNGASTSPGTTAQPDSATPLIESSQHHHARRSLPASMPSSSRRSGSGNALLRQALETSQRRRSYLDTVPLGATADRTLHDRILSSLDAQHAQAHIIGNGILDDSVTASESPARLQHGTAHSTMHYGIPGATSEVSSRGKRRRTSRAASADAEHDAREALMRSCGAGNEVDDSAVSDELGLARPPDLSWAQILDMVFASAEGMSMSNQDIFACIESNYGYYSTAPRGWKNYVREELRVNDKYELDTARRRNSVWRLKQETENHTQNDPQESIDLSQGSATMDDVETSEIIDSGDSEVIDSTSSQPTSQTAPRHVSFSPVVTVSTPVPVRKKTTRRTPQKQDGQPASGIEQPFTVLEIPDSDPSDVSVIPACSPELVTGRSSSPPTVPDIRGPRSSKGVPETPVARNDAVKPARSSASSSRKATASIFKTPKQPSGSRIGKAMSMSDSARRHSTPIINHRFMTPNADTRKRVVETPLRELGDPDEDELAG